MSLTTRVLLGLVLGVAVGLLLRALGEPGALIVRWIEPIGTIWINAIRMVVIPLVFSVLVTGVAAVDDVRRIGRLGVRSLALFFLMLGATAVFFAIVGPPLFSFIELDPVATERLRASAGEIPSGISATTTLRDFFIGMVPTNPIQAAAQGALLPVLVFALLFAFAASRIAPEPRTTVFQFFKGIRDAIFVLIGWIMEVAPIGVFALGVNLVNQVGIEAIGALGYYVLVVIATHLVTGVILYWLAATVGRTPVRLFARAIAPAQAVAISTRSSFASLPAIIEGAERVLKLPVEITGFVIPLAVSTFRLTSPIYWTLGAQLVARLYGIEMGPAQIATIAAAAVLLNPATPGIPSGGLLIMAPVYLAAGLPVEGLGLLIAIDAIPDMLKTAFNVTADLVCAVILARTVERAPEPAVPIVAGA